VRDAMPAAWGNVEVDTWTGLTTAYSPGRDAAGELQLATGVSGVSLAHRGECGRISDAPGWLC
jgi:hypothetical protein